MASVHKGGSGGRARLRNKSFARAADAKAYAAKMEADVERRGVGDPARHTTGQYLARWLATLRDRGEHSPTTLEGYARCIAMAKPWVGDIPLSKLSAADLDHAYGELRKRGGKLRGGAQTRPLTARTVLNIHRCLHAALEQARKWELIAENPASDARAPSPLRSRARAFSADEVRRLLEVAAAHPTTYCMVATLLTCGLRRSELIGLAFDAIDFEAGTLEVKQVGIEVAHRAIIRERAKTSSSAHKLKIPRRWSPYSAPSSCACRNRCCSGAGNIGVIRCLCFPDLPARRCCREQ